MRSALVTFHARIITNHHRHRRIMWWNWIHIHCQMDAQKCDRVLAWNVRRIIFICELLCFFLLFFLIMRNFRTSSDFIVDVKHLVVTFQCARYRELAAHYRVLIESVLVCLLSLACFSFVMSAYQRFSRDKYQFRKIEPNACSEIHTWRNNNATTNVDASATGKTELISFTCKCEYRALSIYLSIYGTQTPNRVFVVPCKYFIDSEIFDYLINV